MAEGWRYAGSVLEGLDRKMQRVFRQQLTAYAAMFGCPVAPVRGGTFFYCNVSACRGRYARNDYGPRFRTLKAYRRHWRRLHGPAPVEAGLPGRESSLMALDEVFRFADAIEELRLSGSVVLPPSAQEIKRLALLDQVRRGVRFGKDRR